MKRSNFSLSVVIATMFGVWVMAGAMPAFAAGSKVIGTFKDWSAHQFVEKKGKVCYLHSRPRKSAGDYKQRGDTYVQVTHRASDGTRNEISITAGYTYKNGSAVALTIGGKKFSLFTDNDTAWGSDAKADNALVAAMRAGAGMIVQGTSSRGTPTTDTYSLSGFTAAHKAIDKACGAK